MHGLRLYASDGEFETAPLRLEALQARAQAQHIEIVAAGFNAAENALRGARRHGSATGLRLAALHETDARRRCETITRLVLRPTRSAYLYLDEGDFVELHQDVPPCAMTCLICLEGPAPDLCLVEPEPPERLLDASRRHAGRPPCAERVALPVGRAVVFAGHHVPHYLERPGGPCVLATLCFATLLPLKP